MGSAYSLDSVITTTEISTLPLANIPPLNFKAAFTFAELITCLDSFLCSLLNISPSSFLLKRLSSRDFSQHIGRKLALSLVGFRYLVTSGRSQRMNRIMGITGRLYAEDIINKLMGGEGPEMAYCIMARYDIAFRYPIQAVQTISTPEKALQAE